MSRVITFSRTFPSYHPRKGQPTNFKWKILRSLGIDMIVDPITNGQTSLENFEPKYTTIRGGHRWKQGDMFSPREWSDLPYKSKQTTFAPDIEVKKTYDFDLINNIIAINGIQKNRYMSDFIDLIKKIAINDGLDYYDFISWFKIPKPVTDHQIICWNENINY